jgi:hypothetical protein
MPGIDALERYPSLDFYPAPGRSRRPPVRPRPLPWSSASAAPAGAPRRRISSAICSGSAAMGITDFVFHLSQYRLDTPAITDWPPSEPLHLSWKRRLPGRPRPRDPANSRPIRPPCPPRSSSHPYRGLMAEYEPWELMQTNGHNASTYPDTPAGRMNSARSSKRSSKRSRPPASPTTSPTNARLEEDGAIENGRVRLGRATYATPCRRPRRQLHSGGEVADGGSSRGVAAEPPWSRHHPPPARNIATP